VWDASINSDLSGPDTPHLKGGRAMQRVTDVETR